MQIDFLTREDLTPLQEMVQQILRHQQAAAQPADDYLSIDQVAALAGTTRKTVGKWISEGKYDGQGRLIKLFTLEFSPGLKRVPRSALLAFGQGIGYSAEQLRLPPAGAQSTPKKAKHPPVLDSHQALRKAS